MIVTKDYFERLKARAEKAEADAARLRTTPSRKNPELRQRLVGLTKAIDEEMQLGAREFALAAVSELIDERDALYRKQAELEAEVERLRHVRKFQTTTEQQREVERLREEVAQERFSAEDYKAQRNQVRAEVERLRALLKLGVDANDVTRAALAEEEA
jgi:hypothetical protein